MVACYRAMQRVTVIKGFNCTKFTTVFLQVLRSTVIERLNCGSSVILSVYLQQCIDCVFNLPLNERQCLVQGKQGVYAIKSHDNLRQKASVCFFFSLKGLLGDFLCRGEPQKRPTRNPVCIRETPVRVCEVCPLRQKILGRALKGVQFSRRRHKPVALHDLKNRLRWNNRRTQPGF